MDGWFGSNMDLIKISIPELILLLSKKNYNIKNENKRKKDTDC